MSKLRILKILTIDSKHKQWLQPYLHLAPELHSLKVLAEKEGYYGLYWLHFRKEFETRQNQHTQGVWTINNLIIPLSIKLNPFCYLRFRFLLLHIFKPNFFLNNKRICNRLWISWFYSSAQGFSIYFNLIMKKIDYIFLILKF